MSQFLKDLSIQPPITFIEENNLEFWSHYGRARQAKLHNTPSKLWYTTGIPNPLFNAILRVDFAADQIDAQIDEALLPFLSGQLPVIGWLMVSAAPDGRRPRGTGRPTSRRKERRP